MTHVWFWRCRLPERKGQPCRVLVRTQAGNSALVEFEDGLRVVTSRFAVRRLTPPQMIRNQEKLLILEPMLSRQKVEHLEADLDWAFATLYELGYFPDPPDIIQAKGR